LAQHIFQFALYLLGGDIFTAESRLLARSQTARDKLLLEAPVFDVGSQGLLYETGQGFSVLKDAFGRVPKLGINT